MLKREFLLEISLHLKHDRLYLPMGIAKVRPTGDKPEWFLCHRGFPMNKNHSPPRPAELKINFALL